MLHNPIKFSRENTEIDVNVKVGAYMSGGSLAVMLESPEVGAFSNLTVNLHDPGWECEGKYAFVDTNNMPGAEDFIRENDLASPVGYYGKSGFCVYPLYAFNLDKLKDLDPEGFEDFERAQKYRKENK